MKRTIMALFTSVALVGGAGVALAHGESSGRHMSMGDLPAPVQDTLKREAQSNRVEEIRETKDQKGNKEYKAEIVSGKQGTDLTISPDGNVVKRSTHDEAAEHKQGKE